MTGRNEINPYEQLKEVTRTTTTHRQFEQRQNNLYFHWSQLKHARTHARKHTRALARVYDKLIWGVHNSVVRTLLLPLSQPLLPPWCCFFVVITPLVTCIINRKVENARLHDRLECHLVINNSQYSVEFSTMQQTNDETGVRRPVRKIADTSAVGQ